MDTLPDDEAVKVEVKIEVVVEEWTDGAFCVEDEPDPRRNFVEPMVHAGDSPVLKVVYPGAAPGYKDGLGSGRRVGGVAVTNVVVVSASVEAAALEDTVEAAYRGRLEGVSEMTEGGVGSSFD